MINVASLSLDLDDKWTYLKTHGDSTWKSLPSYYDIVIPRILKILKKNSLKITFFIVGRDAAIDRNREILRSITDAKHEIGNHSFHHDPWLHLYTEKQIEVDILKSEEHIEKITSQKPIGFRGPGFSMSRTILEILKKRGYLYDATKLPTYLAPFSRAYFLMTSKLSKEEKEKRKSLFGSFGNGLYPNKPYYWKLDTGQLLEIPITTVPFFKTPFHASYILYISTFNAALAISYFKFALKLCRLRGVQPSLLLHPLDFLGYEDEKDLSFFPAMRIPKEKKLSVLQEILSVYSSQYEIFTIGEYTKKIFRTINLKERKIS